MGNVNKSLINGLNGFFGGMYTAWRLVVKA